MFKILPALILILCLFAWYSPSDLNTDKKTQSSESMIPSSIESRKKVQFKQENPQKEDENESKSMSLPLSSKEENGTLEVDSEPLPREDEDRFIEDGLKKIAWMKSLPGAEELVEDIILALEDNPEAFQMEALNGELNEDYLEKMIPSPELRAKWEKLMALVVAAQENMARVSL